jgi:hypothetical protein
MAKLNPSTLDADSQREAERERLLRELGLDKLTYQECVRVLFGELLGPAPTTDDQPRDPVRVVQAGPGRRGGR